MSIRRATFILAGAIAAFALYARSTGRLPDSNTIPAHTETAVFSGGCFWGLQAAFDELPGVVTSRVGYTGGSTPNPTYSKVVIGSTGHAEAVEITFDPKKIDYSDLVNFHLDHVRPIRGTLPPNYASRHYRSSIFVLSAEQRFLAEQARSNFNDTQTGKSAKHVLIEEAAIFWEAEAEHQNYLAKCAY